MTSYAAPEEWDGAAIGCPSCGKYGFESLQTLVQHMKLSCSGETAGELLEKEREDREAKRQEVLSRQSETTKANDRIGERLAMISCKKKLSE